MMPKSNMAAHCFLGSGISRDIRAKTARNTEIEAAPEHSALMITTRLSLESVVIEIAVPLVVIAIKFFAIV